MGRISHGAPEYAALRVTPDELLHGGEAAECGKGRSLKGGFTSIPPPHPRFTLAKKRYEYGKEV